MKGLIKYFRAFFELFHDGGRYPIETSSLICRAKHMQSIFLYDNGLRHERVNICITIQCHCAKFSGFNLFQCRSNPPKVFLLKGVLKVCSKFIGEHPCRSAISIKLYSFIGIKLRHGCSPPNLLHIFRIPLYKNPSGELLLPMGYSGPCQISMIKLFAKMFFFF